MSSSRSSSSPHGTSSACAGALSVPCAERAETTRRRPGRGGGAAARRGEDDTAGRRRRAPLVVPPTRPSSSREDLRARRRTRPRARRPDPGRAPASAAPSRDAASRETRRGRVPASADIVPARRGVAAKRAVEPKGRHRPRSATMSRWRDEEASSNPPRWLANRRIDGSDTSAPSALGSIGRRRRKRPRAASATTFQIYDELTTSYVPTRPPGRDRGVLWAPHGTSAVPGAPYLPRVARPRATTPNGAAADATAPKTRDERRRSERRFEREARPPPARGSRAPPPSPPRAAPRSIRRGSENGLSRLPRPWQRTTRRPTPARPRPPTPHPAPRRPRPPRPPPPRAASARCWTPRGCVRRPRRAGLARPLRGLRPPRTPPPRRDRGFFASNAATRRSSPPPPPPGARTPARPLLFDAAPSTLVRRARRP